MGPAIVGIPILVKEILNGDKEILQHQLNSSNGNWCHPDI